MNTQPKSTTKMLVNQRQGARWNCQPGPWTSSLGKAAVYYGQAKGYPALKTSKMARKSAPSSQAAAHTKQLVCRYCGSADLAPSFSKRRDARCRHCFKQRYGSIGPKKTTRILKTKVAN